MVINNFNINVLDVYIFDEEIYAFSIARVIQNTLIHITKRENKVTRHIVVKRKRGLRIETRDHIYNN